MAISIFERFLLKNIVYGDLMFRPEALDPEIVTEESPKMVRARFAQLSKAERQPFRDYFALRPAFPFQVFRKSNTPGTQISDYKFHYEYDLPDQKTEARRLVLAGFDMDDLRGEYFNFSQLHELRKAYESGLDITPLLDNRYSRFQLKVLVPAMRRGMDISEMLDPDIPAREMAAMYYDAFERKILDYIEEIGNQKQLDASESLMEKKPSLDQILDRAQSKQLAQSQEKSKVVDFSAFKKKQEQMNERF